METLTIPTNASRQEIYDNILPQIAAIIKAETNLIANLANISAILKEALGFFWIGFYRNIEGELVLGPFQGTLACTRIPFHKGVCGACATQQKTLVVPDVEQFPGHIACSSLSRSEIVVPLVQEGITKLVFDIDSVHLSHFSELDARYLEQIMIFIDEQHPNINTEMV